MIDLLFGLFLFACAFVGLIAGFIMTVELCRFAANPLKNGGWIDAWWHLRKVDLADSSVNTKYYVLSSTGDVKSDMQEKVHSIKIKTNKYTISIVNKEELKPINDHRNGDIKIAIREHEFVEVDGRMPHYTRLDKSDSYVHEDTAMIEIFAYKSIRKKVKEFAQSYEDALKL